MGGLTRIFGGGEAMPTPQPAPPPPTTDTSAVRAAEEQERRLRSAAAGRASTILTGGTGVTEPAPTAGKMLLGQ